MSMKPIGSAHQTPLEAESQSWKSERGQEDAVIPKRFIDSLQPTFDSSSQFSRSIEPQARANSNERSITEILTAVQHAVSTPVASGAGNIPVLDEDGHYLRYYFPNFTMLNYWNVSEVSQFYNGKGVALRDYDPSIGCFAMIGLIKTREQAEDDYEDILKEFPGERHPVNTDITRDYGTVLYRKFHPEEYAQWSKKRREQQLAGLQKIVDRWKKTGEFEDVFVPSNRFLIETLKFFPENITDVDRIILVFKKLPPEKLVPGVVQKVFPILPSIEQCQLEARRENDLRNRSLVSTLWGSIPSLPTLPRFFSADRSDEPGSAAEHALEDEGFGVFEEKEKPNPAASQESESSASSSSSFEDVAEESAALQLPQDQGCKEPVAKPEGRSSLFFFALLGCVNNFFLFLSNCLRVCFQQWVMGREPQ